MRTSPSPMVETEAREPSPVLGGELPAGLDLIYRETYRRARLRRAELAGWRWALYRLRAAAVGTPGAPGIAIALAARRRGAPRPWVQWVTATRAACDAAGARAPMAPAGDSASLGTNGAITGRPDGPVLVTGVVPAGPGGMRDYGDLLGRELGQRGVAATVAWRENDGGAPLSGLRVGLGLLASGWRVERGTAVVWNYAPVPLGVAGVPGPGVFLGVVLRLRRIPTVVVLHELAQPLHLPGWKAKLVGTAQLVALGPVLAGVSDAVATTDNRARWLQPGERWLRFRVHLLPIFSNFDPPDPRPAPRVATDQSDGDVPLAVVLDYAADYARPDVVVEAIGALARRRGPIRLVLLGAPGPDSEAATRWRALAETAGVADRLSFTGVVDREGFGRWLSRADLVILPNTQGPSSRKGTLAAALAHGAAIVAFDGLLRWQRLVDADAVVVVPPHGPSLATVIESLLESPEHQAGYRQRAATFYEAHLSLQKVTDGIAHILAQQASHPRAGPAPKLPTR